jgi:hypothetical protein
MDDRHTEMYRYGTNFLSIPKYVHGRLTGEDFLYFNWCEQLAPHVKDYTVVISTLSPIEVPFKGIGKLAQAVELPPILLPSPGRVGVIPNSPHLPSFEADLVIGSSYYIPKTGKNGIYQMRREGMLRLN